MLRTIIIDDEIKAREVIKDILRKKCHDITVVDEAESIKTGIAAIEKYNPDLVLLDINLGNGTGFDILKKIKPINFKIIFITAYERYAVDAFRYSAVDYILKPVIPRELVEAIEKVKKYIQTKEDNKYNLLLEALKSGDSGKLIIPTITGYEFVEISNIIRIEADSGYSIIYKTNNSKITIPRNLSEIEEQLSNKTFYRTHKSHLINLRYIESYNRKDGKIVMTDGTVAEVSLRKKDEFNDLIKAYLKKR